MEYKKHKIVPEVTLGKGALNRLSKLGMGKIALIVDEYLLGTSTYQNLTENILSARDYQLICSISEEPSYEVIDRYIPVIREYEPDYIVVIGGGSAMDTAKALWLFYEFEDMDWETAVTGSLPSFPGKASLIAVPTTSGTGSEVTGAGVYKRYDGIKTMILSDEIRPCEAILDYDLLESLPRKVIAHAGVDALAHVLGALSCKNASILDQIVCEQTVVKIMKHLPRSYQGDLESRAVMHVCAYLAGDMINNAGGGLEHKLDRFAKEYHLPHGLVIGILLPYTMRYLLHQNHYTEIAGQLGIYGNPEDKQKQLLNQIWELYDVMEIPRTLKETGIPEIEFMQNIPEYIRQVKEIGHIYGICGFGEIEDLEQIYKQAYYGIEREDER